MKSIKLFYEKRKDTCLELSNRCYHILLQYNGVIYLTMQPGRDKLPENQEREL